MEGLMLIKDVMTKSVKTARYDDTVQDAVRKMNKFGIGSLIIVDEGMRPIGIITEDDILKRIVEPCLDPSTMSVRDIMSSPLVTITEDASVEEAARLMTRKGIKRLPVLRGKELVGIITATDIARYCPSYVRLLSELKIKPP